VGAKNAPQGIEKSIPVMEYLFASILNKYSKDDPKGKKMIAYELLNVIKSIADPIEKNYWLKKLSDKLSVEDDVLTQVLEKVKLKEKVFSGKNTNENETEERHQVRPRSHILQERLIGLSSLFFIELKEEYEKIIPKIIQHMKDMPYLDIKGREYKYGEFFPSELSPFAYNETIAGEYFPLTKDQARGQGYRWKDEEERNYKINIKTEDLLDIYDEAIINKIIECKHKGDCNHQCTTAFKLIPEELQFYKSMNLPLPRLCPNCRHYARLAQRNPMKLWKRSCMKEGCDNEFETSYAPEREEIVYCEGCYQKEVY